MAERHCVLCRASSRSPEVRFLFYAWGVYICDHCIQQAHTQLCEQRAEQAVHGYKRKGVEPSRGTTHIPGSEAEEIL